MNKKYSASLLRFSLFFSSVLMAFTLSAQENAKYSWKNAQIHGGGFISGVIFHPTESDLVYCRTDVGGAYRLNPNDNSWIALNDDLASDQNDFLGVLSLALDPNDKDKVYLLTGLYTQSWAGNGAFMKSTDQGETWDISALPFKVGGNEDGRSAGERLQVDPNLSTTLFLGSSNDGLWKSTNEGASFSKVTSFPQANITFVLFDKSTGSAGNATQTIYVGTANTSNSIYKSTDGGATWNALANQPSFLARHAVISAGKLFAVYCDQLGPNGVTDGAVYSFDIQSGAATDISPATSQGGFGGISADAQNSGTIIVSTFDQWWPKDEMYYSTDGGASWESLFMENNYPYDDKASFDHSKTPYTSTHTPHWIGDVQIDPHNSRRAFFTTGYGVYASYNLTLAANKQATSWTFESVGIEETVPLALISPSEGANLISCLGDIDGFKHDDLNASPAHRLTPEMGTNRDMAFAALSPSKLIRAHDVVNATSHASISSDGGETWSALPSEPSGVEASGKISLSANGDIIIWAPGGISTAYSSNGGANWATSNGVPEGLKVVCDPVINANSYAYDWSTGNFYRSTDGGANYTAVSSGLPTLESWNATNGTINLPLGQSEDVWLTSKTNGLWRTTNGGTSFTKFNNVEEAYKVSFGKARTGSDYPAVFIHGKINSVPGFYRSDDEGATWLRINDDQNQFGGINVITGDPRVFGRLYLGTAGRGIVYGDRLDCNEVVGGDAVIDVCEKCAGGNTGITPVFDPNNCNVTNIQYAENDNQYVYPNPVDNTLYLSSSVSWELTTLSGIHISQGTSSTINTSILSGGVYLLKTEGEVFRIIKE